MRFLKRHPFPVAAWFERVVAVSFAFPEAALRALAPAPLEIDTYEGFGFVTVSLVWTKHLRPAGLPAFCGQDFFLAGYRVFTRLRNPSGRKLRGLKIVRSETDKWRMVWLGNLLTDYRYRKVQVRILASDASLRVQTSTPDGRPTLDLSLKLASEPGAPPDGSPFPDLRTARRFAGPMPYTFSPRGDGTFVVIEGRRQDWAPRPIEVAAWQVSLFDETPLRDAKPILANAFALEGVSYRWERGRIMRPGGAP